MLFQSFEVYLANLVALLPSQILLSYVILYVLIPKFLIKRKYLIFAIAFLVLLYFSMAMARFLTIYVVENITNRGFPKESIWEILTQIPHLLNRYLLTVLVAPLIMVPIKLVKDRLEARNKIEELEKEKANAQLSFLKAQIHPHFLFNTLNNLYVLTLEKRDEAPEIILKLSAILDYMLYQCNGPTVPLEKEVELLENYIDLEKLRYNERLAIHFETDIQNGYARITPLILLPLVENAFKHGASTSSKDSRIEISLKQSGTCLEMKVHNTKPVSIKASKSGGVGLSNMKSQLELQYKGRHEMSVEEGNDYYRTHLKLEI